MAKVTKAPYSCTECGWTAIKWVGRCGECQAWGTVVEVAAASGPKTVSRSLPHARRATRIGEVDATQSLARPTGVGEFDRVLGGGLVPGAVVLVAGEPGIGKSTLLLDVSAHVARQGMRVLYVTGEESAAQVRLRAERIEAMAAQLYLAAESDLGDVLGQIDAVDPHLVIVDSVQTIASTEVEGVAGNVSQVREVAAALIRAAKSRNTAMLLVGHVTKDGSIAGPRVLEHLVDVVLAFEGERLGPLRLVRAVKNRYGPTDEVGCFELGEAGLVGLPDPSGLFTTHRDRPAEGSAVTVTLEGRRPMLVEVQGLASPAANGSPRRTTQGVESARSAMIVAVLGRLLASRLAGSDVYLSTVGGARANEPAADLALAVALASSAVGREVVAHCVVLGEVGLGGEVRRVPGVARRLTEAARLGFSRAVIPAGSLEAGLWPEGMTVHEVSTIGEALALMLVAPS